MKKLILLVVLVALAGAAYFALRSPSAPQFTLEDGYHYLYDGKSLDGWRAQLQAHGVAIEMEVNWEQGGTSIYFRDPAGNSIELAPPTLWGPLH